jgi:hypothetical protein
MEPSWTDGRPTDWNVFAKDEAMVPDSNGDGYNTVFGHRC